MVQLPSLQTPVLEVATARIKAPGFNSSFLESEDTHVCISILVLPETLALTATYLLKAKDTKNPERALWVPYMPGPYPLDDVAAHVLICLQKAMGLFAWSPAGFWPNTHLGIQLVHLASSLIQSILGG